MMKTVDKRYESEKDYQKDKKKMEKDGWYVVSRSDFQPGRGFARIVLTGFLTKPKKQIIVVYGRESE